VVPRTPHFVSNDQPFGERSAVVRACRADRVELVPTPRDQHLLSLELAGEHAAVRDVTECNALFEIDRHGVLIECARLA
jgi:hypothetical protein